MNYLIWGGAVVSVIGILGIFYCILMAAKVRSAGFDDASLRARLQKVFALNMGALFVSVTGLMMVVAGIFLR